MISAAIRISTCSITNITLDKSIFYDIIDTDAGTQAIRVLATMEYIFEK